MVRIQCQGCQVSLKIKDELANKTLKCPKCKAAVKVPAVPDAPLSTAPPPTESIEPFPNFVAPITSSDPVPGDADVGNLLSEVQTQTYASPYSARNRKRGGAGLVIAGAIGFVALIAGGAWWSGILTAEADSPAKPVHETFRNEIADAGSMALVGDQSSNADAKTSPGTVGMSPTSAEPETADTANSMTKLTPVELADLSDAEWH